MKTFAQRDFARHNAHFSDKRLHNMLDRILRVWIPLTLSIFGSVWMLSLIYQFSR